MFKVWEKNIIIANGVIIYYVGRTIFTARNFLN